MNIDLTERSSSFLLSAKSEEEILKKDVRKKSNVGIKQIDEEFGFPSGFYVLAGNPGAGKGWFALWLIQNAWVYNQRKSVYFSLEMSIPVVKGRILQQWSNMTKSQYDTGLRPTRALEMIKKDVVIVDDFFSEDLKYQTPKNFEDIVDFYYQRGIRCFHFDHLHEISGANDKNFNQGIMELWSKTFQRISKKYTDIWLFVYVQPNGRGYDKNILKKQDISGSKVIIQKCDYFLSLNRIQPDMDSKKVNFGALVNSEIDRTVYLYLDKNRHTDVCNRLYKLKFLQTGNFERID